jgi:hypothetical protein
MSGPSSNVIPLPGVRPQGGELRRALTELRDRAGLVEAESRTIARRLTEILEREARDVG